MDNLGFQLYKLSDEIKNAIDKLGYKEPTPVQQGVIPCVLEDRDVIVRSQTGSGKTAAYAIPICEKVDWLENKPQALVLVPTRELAIQVKEDFTNIGRYKRIKAIAVYGRHSFSAQKLELKQKNHVVVGTPGRVMDHLERGTLNLQSIRYLVIDEADEMLNMGFIDQVDAILKHLPTNRINMLFSATLPQRIKDMACAFMNNPEEIETNHDEITVEHIKHTSYQVLQEEKLSTLVDVTMIGNPDSCIIFCNTKEGVEEVHKKLQGLGYPCNKIHGGMEQEDRIKTMKAFKSGAYRYLIATDVAARGIDIENISLVINYDVPLKRETYVHRIGRTGRAGAEGSAITFVTSREERYMDEIEKYVGFEIAVGDKPTKELVNQCKKEFEVKSSRKPVRKKEKSEQLDRNIVTLYFNGGKKKKLRATNFVGAISNIEGVSADDIGIITISDTLTYVDILNGKGQIVLKAMQYTTICGKQLKVAVAKKK